MKHFTLYLVVGIACLMFLDVAHAKDAIDSAHAAQAYLTRVGLACLGLGITIGGIAYAAGFPTIGKYILGSGFAGALCILLTPGALSAAARIFGVSL
ncbi:hypothetical protein [Bdellovibrio sp. HCB-162]|uniref:hypothetical protein n=1 Tax=Bdellovibrio sp. HCB-162 TaxID=3394234 RepID=UPI0039BCD09E